MRDVIVPLLALLTACGSDTPKVAGTCKTTQDCESGKICNVRGYCQARLGCASTADCGSHQTCEPSTGTCLCENDLGCEAGQICNASKRCQPQPACGYNSDCPAGQICDTASRQCMAEGSCASSLQCGLGQICDASQRRCVNGCATSGDCPQTSINGQGITVFAPSACIGGTCQAGKCTSTLGCAFGQVCTGGNCVSACSSGPHCRSCKPLDALPCGDFTSVCMDDSRNAASCTGNPSSTCRYFCGVDCASGQPCPAGYECSSLVVVTQGQSCTCGQQCGNGSGPCDCNEGAASGFCHCVGNDDCGGYLSPYTCSSDGYCLAGQACAPVKGLYCDNPGPACP